MISKNEIKYIRSLKLKKHRNRERKFLVEGIKNVSELIQSDFKVIRILGTQKFLEWQTDLVEQSSNLYETVSQKELTELSSLKVNGDCLAVAEMKESQQPNYLGLVFVLDSINDPGNLGTIVRTLDWYGFTELVCSNNCADFYNPKTLSATMGSFVRITPFYAELTDILQNLGLPIIGAQMEGSPINTYTFPEKGVILMGSESHGISQDIRPLLSDSITIPRFGKAESLNVAMATTAICHSIRFS